MQKYLLYLIHIAYTIVKFFSTLSLSLPVTDTLDTMVSLVVAGSGVSVVSLEMFFPFTDCRVHDRYIYAA